MSDDVTAPFWLRYLALLLVVVFAYAAGRYDDWPLWLLIPFGPMFGAACILVMRGWARP